MEMVLFLHSVHGFKERVGSEESANQNFVVKIRNFRFVGNSQPIRIKSVTPFPLHFFLERLLLVLLLFSNRFNTLRNINTIF